MPYKTFGTETLTASDVQTYLMDQCVIRCTSTTRPSSPSEGWHIYETDTRRRLVYTSGVWRPEGIYEQVQIKSETQKVSGWFTPVYDKDLRFDLAANSVYWLEGFLMFQQAGETPANNKQFTSLGWTFPDASPAWKTRTCWNAPMGDPTGTSADTKVRLGTYAFPEAWKFAVNKRDAGMSDSDPSAYIYCGHSFCAWADASGGVCDVEAMIKTTIAGTLILTWAGGWGGTDNLDLRLLANSWVRVRRAA